MEYAQPFEQTAVDFLNTHGVKATQALKVLEFKKKYELSELEKIFKDAGADLVGTQDRHSACGHAQKR
jgi:hypothetical protein